MTTQRSSRNEPKNPLDALEERIRQRVLGVQSVLIQRLCLYITECFNLLHDVSAHSTSGLWFRILPIDGHEDDICVGTGVKWQY